jgi:hypothetical protein
MALACLGVAVCLLVRGQRTGVIWWAGVMGGALAFIVAVPYGAMPVWNHRYALLFILPFWIMAAYAMEYVAGRLGSTRQVVLWYGCVALMLAPKLVSHYLDGSRLDCREAARVAASEVRPGETICSNLDLRTWYYLPRPLHAQLHDWEPTEPLPPGPCVVICGGNVWQPVLETPGRPMTVLDQIGRRRYDELSYAVRVYRVAPAPPGTKGMDARKDAP